MLLVIDPNLQLLQAHSWDSHSACPLTQFPELPSHTLAMTAGQGVRIAHSTTFRHVRASDETREKSCDPS
jgi:hypothetical protein